MTADRAARPDPWVGCVVGIETGVAIVLTDRGELRASYSGRMLGAIARDRSVLPSPGDWVVLRLWTDDRVTVEARLDRAPAPEARCLLAPVIPLRRH